MTRQELARGIREMRYDDLSELGRELHEMTQSDDGKSLWDLSQRHQWAEVLFAWAEAQADVENDDKTFEGSERHASNATPAN